MPFMQRQKDVHFLVVGDGDITGSMKEKGRGMGVNERMYFTGILRGKEKIDAYHAMDIFVFASKSETQGIVLNEAMASGVPVIGLDAPGVREVIEDGTNGYLIVDEDKKSFSRGLDRFYNLESNQKESFRNKARIAAGMFDYSQSIQKTLNLYQENIDKRGMKKNADNSMWTTAKRAIKREMEIISNVVTSASVALNIKKDQNESEKG
jgi:glycosyltransferase involved in cell wall biosynthesis